MVIKLGDQPSDLGLVPLHLGSLTLSDGGIQLIDFLNEGFPIVEVVNGRTVIVEHQLVVLGDPAVENLLVFVVSMAEIILEIFGLKKGLVLWVIKGF